MSTALGISKNPEKYEAKALQYEQNGKTQKAIKYRQKAANLRQSGHLGPHGNTGSTGTMGGMGGIGGNTTGMGNTGMNTGLVGGAPIGTSTTYVSTTTTGIVGGQQTGLMGNQLGGQQMGTTGLVGGQQMGTTGLMGNQIGGQQMGTTGLMGNQMGGQQMGTSGLAGGQMGMGYSSRQTPDLYERNALKWEGRNNYTKAQKNREKVWRMQNPQYAQSTSAPSFYQNNQFLGYNVPFQGGATSLQKQPIMGHQTGFSSSVTNAPIVETHVRPTIVEQTSRQERIVEVQPVIHREIDAPQVRVIEKHVYETVPSTGPSTITKQAIVEETVRPRIIEEVQPVVHREVPQTFVERVEQHVTEHIVKPTTTTKEVIQDTNVHVAAGGPMVGQQNMMAGQQNMMAGQQNMMGGQQNLAGQQQGGLLGRVGGQQGTNTLGGQQGINTLGAQQGTNTLGQQGTNTLGQQGLNNKQRF